MMTVMPARSCPRRSGSRTVRLERYPFTKSPGRLQRCVSSRCLRWLPGVIRIRQNNGSRVYGTCSGKNPRCACKSASRRHHGSPAAYQLTVCHRGCGPGLFSRTASGGKKSQSCATDAVTVRLDTDSDENTGASLGSGKSVCIPAAVAGCSERVLQ